MTKFTKGKWEYRKEDGIVYDNDFSIVCDTMTTGMDHEEANAHLIAAAPDMYKMLERQKQGLWNLIDLNIIKENYKNDAKDLINDIDKLLDKARGE